MSRIGVIGGTGLNQIEGLELIERRECGTPFGDPSAPLLIGRYHERELVFLSRHGSPHRIPPHKVNYRANLWALRELGVDRVLAVAAVGGIGPECGPGRIVVPDQLIDYTYGRAQTFFEDGLEQVVHVDFSQPYTPLLRQLLLQAARDAGIDAVDGGVYGATQGPRLETVAEIDRMQADGCTLVGMTGMPEAALARELELDYACCAVVANWAAGRGETEIISMAEIEAVLMTGMAQVRRLLARALSLA